MKTWQATPRFGLRNVTTHESRRGEQGILLMDCLVYLSIWVVVLGLAFSTFYQCLTYSKNLARNADDIARALKAGERWREDVREATGPLRLVSEGGAEQAVHIPHKSGEVVYLFIGDTVLRRAGTDTAWTPVLSGLKSSRTENDDRQRVICWRWEVELKNQQKVARVRPLFTFQAVAAIKPEP
jgi:hypothetical protein